MNDRVLRTISHELEKVREAKERLGRSKGRQRLMVYKRLHALEEALDKTLERLSSFKEISHLV
ncbi:MAG: hypothetical protein ACOX6V_00805 [Patescibacteria group bacterium]|jgi:hypothetical protein